MFFSTVIFEGFANADLVLFLNRLVVGLFFAISGYHKLFVPLRHAQLVQTLKDDNIPFVWFCCWAVPLVEFFGGLALILGFMAPLAALGLLIIMSVAICKDAPARVAAFEPIDKADVVDDVLYLSETTYWFMCLFVIIGGSGMFSLHSLFI